jgi:transposase
MPRLTHIDTSKDEIIQLYESGKSLVELGSQFGSSDLTIKKRLVEWGVRARTAQDQKNKHKETAISLYEQGWAIPAIAQHIGVVIGTISKWFEQWEVERRPKEKPLDEYRELIIQRYLSGDSLEKIALDYNIKYNGIRARLSRWGIEIREKGARKYPVNHDAFADINEQSLYVAGYIATDGNVYDGCRVSIVSHDKDVLEKIRDFSGSPDRPLYTKPGGGKKSVGRNFVYEMRSWKMAEDLNRLYGITPRKSKTLSLPVDSPALLNRHWWRGCVDGDGWVSIGKSGYMTIALCSASLQFIEQYRDFLTTIGVYRGQKINKKPTYDLYSLALSGEPAVRLAKILYEGAGIYLDRKYHKAIRYIQEYEASKKEVVAHEKAENLARCE